MLCLGRKPNCISSQSAVMLLVFKTNLMGRERAEEKVVSFSWCDMQYVSDVFSVLPGDLGIDSPAVSSTPFIPWKALLVLS